MFFTTGVNVPSTAQDLQDREIPISERRGLPVSERRLLLALGDGVAVAASFLIAFNLRSAPVRHEIFAVPRVALGIVLMVWFVCAELVDGYRLVGTVDVRSTFRTVASALSLSFVALLGVFFLVPYRITRPTLLLWIPLAGALVLAWRSVFQRVFSRAIFAGNLVIIADRKTFERTWAELQVGLPDLYRVVDIIEPDRPDVIARLANLSGADVVIGARDGVSRELFRVLVACYDRGIRVRSLADLYQEMTGRLPLDQLGYAWLMSLPMRSETSRVYASFKRAVDVVSGAVGFLLLGALYPFVALAIRLDDGGPTLYRQRRLGKYGRPFEILKLRTMRAGEAMGERQTDAADPRVTRVARVLRRLHLDELPQAINILRGDMSLVGPRPEQPQYVALMRQQIEFYSMRLSVRPGLTGWAQVNYGYGQGIDGAREKLSYDLYYITHQGFGLDVLILTRTLRAVFSLKGR